MAFLVIIRVLCLGCVLLLGVGDLERNQSVIMSSCIYHEQALSYITYNSVLDHKFLMLLLYLSLHCLEIQMMNVLVTDLL